LVECDRCHRKFGAYSSLLQHYRDRHSNVTNLSQIQRQVIAEKEAESAYKVVAQTRGPSRVKLVAFALIIIIGISVVGYVAFLPKEESTKTVREGSAAPDFSLPDTAGGTFRLSEYRGKSNVLLFFSEGLSCQPCLQQIVELDGLYQDFRNMEVVVVSITGDRLDLLTNWASTSGPRYGLVLSDQTLEVSRMYDMLGADVSMMPGTAPGHTFLLVDKSGVVVWRRDYGPANMWVPNSEILVNVRQALQG